MNNNHVQYYLLFLSTLFLTSNIVTVDYWGEYLELFDSTITVNKDASLDVIEKIIYVDLAYPNKHGIVREFPVHYKDTLGNTITVDFTVKRVLKDGHPVDYHIENALNGKVIKIGSASTMLSLGKHTYILEYQTGRQIGFFKDSDELSWGVTGYGWRMPIKKVTGHVILPKSIPSARIGFELYTGYEGLTIRNYNSRLGNNNTIDFTSDTVLPRQGVKLVAYWPKGFITEPRTLTKIVWFLRDNLTILWLLLGWFVTAVYAFLVAKKIRSKVRPGTIIPLFEPPKDLSPGDIRYVVTRAYDAVGFAAQIVDLAVQGFITIEYKKKLISDVYTLIKNTEQPNYSTREQTSLMENLFSKTTILVLHKAYNSTVETTMGRVKALIESNLGYKHFDSHSSSAGKLFLVTGISIVPVIPFLQLTFAEIGLLGALVIVNLLFYYAVQTYTPIGRKLADEIEGFKLFLQTTEIERLKIVGTPPTKTPQLYEKYLPYAMALGVEEAWTQQFASVFKSLAQQNHTYQPVWYSGSSGFNPVYFNTGFTSRVNRASVAPISTSTSTISSSSSAPGSSSGRGGGGSYGGGGGGGSW